MNRLSARRWLLPLVSLGFLAMALWVLRRDLRALTPADVVAGLRTVPALAVLVAAALTALSHGILTRVDWLATRHVGVRQPFARVGMAAFLGSAFSQALGFFLPSPAPVRSRLYSSWGVEGPEIARVVAFRMLTVWVGFAALAGIVFSMAPVPSLAAVGLPGAVARGVGAVLLLLAVGYLVVARLYAGRSVGESLGLRIPDTPVALGQVALSAAGWMTSAGVLFVLLPGEAGLAYATVLGLYLLAQGAGYLSTIPQGLGVFEAVFLAGLPPAAVDGSLVASLVVFRAVYYLTPLFLAAATLAVLELRRREDVLERAVAAVGSGAFSATPLLLSGAVFVAGALLLVTGALPVTGRLGWLGRLPLPVLEASHFLGSVAGAALLILSWGLARRLDGALHATVGLLVAGAVLTVLRSGDATGAPLLLLLAAGLWAARREFFRPTALTQEPLSPEWMAGAVAVLVGTVWIGFWAYRDVAPSDELWWRFALGGDAPRFLRASLGGAAVLLAFGVQRLLRTPEPDETDEAVPEGAAAAVVDASSRPSARLAYLGDKRLLLSKSGQALIMYGVEGRSWVSLGDPVGDPEDFRDLVWMYRSRTHKHGGWPVFYQVTPDWLPLYVDAGLTLLKLGEEAVVDVQGFSLEGGARAGMRKTVRRAEKDGATFDVIPPERVADELGRLREISDAWLAAKDAREKSFSLGSFSEDYVGRFPAAVARVEGRVVAFANMLLGGDGREFSLDLMRYDPAESPDGVMQYVFARSLLWGKEHGYTRFGMGMAPLSGLETGPLAPLSARLGALVFRHGEHFYNFQGLRAYKEKFDPVWEPRYLASPGGLALPRIVGNIATLVSGGARGLFPG